MAKPLLSKPPIFSYGVVILTCHRLTMQKSQQDHAMPPVGSRIQRLTKPAANEQIVVGGGTRRN